MDADRERLAVGALDLEGDAEHPLRSEALAAGTVREGEDFFSGPGAK